MTTTHPASHRTSQASHRSPAPHIAVPNLSAELRSYLSERCFPATRDELQATLVGRHAPARLLWVLASLPSTRRYDDVDKLCAALEAPSRPSLPLEPI